MTEIAISGIGAVLPTGLGIGPAWDSWLGGNSAVGTFSHPLLRTQRIVRYGAVPEDARAIARESTAFKMRRYGTGPSLWAVNAAEQAIADSGIDWDAMNEERRGAFTGQGDYSFPDFDALRGAFASARREADPFDQRKLARQAMHHRGADPFISIKALANNALALTSLKLRCRGVGCAYVQNEAAAISALNRGILELREMRCDVALVIACGSYAEPFTLAQMWARGLLGTECAPVDAIRSFDADARGAVLGEGAVALLLERRDDIQKRTGTIHGVVEIARGYAAAALRTEELREPSYRHVVTSKFDHGRWAAIADGRGHPLLDRIEARSIADALPKDMPISTTRAIGGVIPAAGVLLDIALATRVLATGMLPQIQCLRQPVDDGPAWVREAPMHHDFDHALCLQQGFSGYHSAAIVQRAC
jgi:3-oxoacyl-[acyl-carrier-protein] synthase II